MLSSHKASTSHADIGTTSQEATLLSFDPIARNAGMDEVLATVEPAQKVLPEALES